MAHANIGLIIYFYIIHCTYDHCVYTKTFRRKQRYSTVHRSVRLFENLWNHHEWWYFFLIKKGNWSCFFFASLFTIFLFCRHFVCCSLILVLRLLLAHLESKRVKGEKKTEKNDNISRKRCWKKRALKMHQHKYKRIISHFQLFIFDPRHLYFKPRKCVRPVYRRNSITCINEIFNVVTEHHQSTSKKTRIHWRRTILYDVRRAANFSFYHNKLHTDMLHS